MRWAGCIALTGISAICLATTSLAQAQADVAGPTPATPATPSTAQAQPLVDFDIPEQPLASALIAFGSQSGYQVSVAHGSLTDRRAPRVAGRLAPDEALRRLLAGTGVTWRFQDNRTVVLSRPDDGSGVMQLDPVQVQGYPVPSQAMIDNAPPPYAGGQVATGGQLGLLGNRNVMDTPFNQTNYTAKKAQDQQATTVKDVLIDDPSVRSYYPSTSDGGDSVRIRGFQVSSVSYAYGGLFGVLPEFSQMAELADRVEVLKGPSVLLNGMPPFGSIGGTVNIVPKRAPDESLTQATASYGSAGQFGGHIDFGRRFGDDKQFGVRFNGVFRAGNTAVENNTDKRGLGVLGLDFRGEHVRLSADLGYQYQYIGGVTPYIVLSAGVPLPWAPDASKNQGQPWNYSERKDLFGVVRTEVDLTERITAYAAFGAHDFRYASLRTTNFSVTSFYGTGTTQNPQNSSQYRSYFTADAGVRALVDTGPIGHELAVTGTTYEGVSGVGTAVGSGAFATNLYNPTIIAQPSIPTPAAPKVSTSSLSSLGFADTLSAADKRIQLTAGLRVQNVTSTNFDATGRATSGYDQSALSPAVALVFKPWQNVSVYGNWIQGLQQGTIVGPTFTNAGEIFPPYKSTQYEAGVKIDWGRFTTTASIFQITQPFTLIDIPANTLLLGGEQRNQGLEVNVFGVPVEGVRLLGGVMLMSPVLTKTQGGTTNGWIAPMSPQLSVNLSGEWDLPFVPSLTVNGRVIYTGSQYIDTEWPRRRLPEWTRFDLGARYAFENPGAKGRLLVARFDVENVLNTSYWAGGCGSGCLVFGAPQTFRLSLSADF